MGPTYKQPGSYFSKFKWSKNCPIFEIDPTTARADPKNANKDPFHFVLLKCVISSFLEEIATDPTRVEGRCVENNNNKTRNC